MQALIEMRAVTKEYRGIPAVTKVDFDLRSGEVHALLGENGAGKSTLTKMMSGVTQPTSGEMMLDGKPVAFASPADALDHGVAMVFQETSLVPSMTVAQNLYLGDEKLFNRVRGLNIAAQTFLQSLNFNVNPTHLVSGLGAAHKQMVEIARAVRKKVRVIIFDEPTAALTPEEKHHFFALVARLKQSSVSIIFISHAIEEALAIADRITILRDGELVASDETGAFALWWVAACRHRFTAAMPDTAPVSPETRCSASRMCPWARSCATPRFRSTPGRSPACSASSAQGARKWQKSLPAW
jgi:simple sugar transport system ATP-binding protein